MYGKKADSQMIEELFKYIISINDINECTDFFEDLCTKQEIEKMAQRIKAARLLSEGKTFKQVLEQCDISTATLSRVSRAVKYGKGYKKLLSEKEF